MTPPPAPSDHAIVNVDWLAAHGAGVAICEVGSSMTGGDPEEEFATRHIAGARYVALDTVLATPPSAAGGRHRSDPMTGPHR